MGERGWAGWFGGVARWDKPTVRFPDVEPGAAVSWAEEGRAQAKPSPLVPLMSGKELLLETATQESQNHPSCPLGRPNRPVTTFWPLAKVL